MKNAIIDEAYKLKFVRKYILASKIREITLVLQNKPTLRENKRGKCEMPRFNKVLA